MKESRSPVAKNVVIMIGDGMGMTTITASRIYKGQKTKAATGESYSLSFDKFPNIGLSKEIMREQIFCVKLIRNIGIYPILQLYYRGNSVYIQTKCQLLKMLN
ncbi:alkaline phosphatase 4-like [Ctenocephalides felis]|uniref:alkaline phosphatase 4-like n=1 Tax=Ctenocephalides felis TaxID=7515 RepID=UPI000E6E5311|nr:alkaline phosphatase 4-like [Ctenocephalides felis]